jgi:hypothetical protein
MTLTKIKEHLPKLDGESLDFIFEHVYGFDDNRNGSEGDGDDKLLDLLRILNSLQTFNYHHRPDDTLQMFGPMSKHLNFELNSDGTTLWLSLLLAIKELYGLSVNELNRLIQLSHVRK